MKILANYNNRQNPNFKYLRLYNEMLYSRFPAQVAERVSKSSEIKDLARSLHKSGKDLVFVCTPTADIVVLDSAGKKYSDLEKEINQIEFLPEKVPTMPTGIIERFFSVGRDFLNIINPEIENEKILDRAFDEVDKFNNSLKA